MKYSSSTGKSTELAIPFIAVALKESVRRHPADEAVYDENVESESGRPLSVCEHIVNFVLYTLLSVQFGTFFYLQDDAVSTLQCPVVYSSIGLFIITAHIFRSVMNEMGPSYDPATLLPEVIVVLSMGFIFFHELVYAYALLLIGKLVMAFTVVVINTYRLWHFENNEDDKLRDDDDEEEGVL